MSPKPSLSLWEYAALPIVIGRIIYTMVSACCRAPFRESGGAPTFKRYVLYAGMRAVVENMTICQFQAINPSTTEAYETVAKRKRFRSDIVKLPDGSLGCWVGDRNAETILVWFHGGGFAYMASTAHVEFLFHVVAQASKYGGRLAVFLLQHDVAPQAQYPRQLEQAVTTIRYLTEDFGKSYSQLLIGGDSAGGNLTIGLLSHLSHPHSTIPSLNSHGWNIKGAILLSPWVSLLDLDSQSFRENRPKDGLSGPGLKAWANAFMKPAQRDNYNCPIDATSDWWRNIRAESILVLAGENEILVDQIRKFAEKLKEHNEEEVDILISPGEAHNPPVDERQLGIHGQNGMIENKLCQWILDRT